MTDDKDEFDRKQRKTQKIVLVIVIPILIVTAGLILLSDLNSEEEKPSFIEILSQVDLKCYNVNWFGVHGFQTTYMTTIEQIGLKLDEYDYDFSNEAFFKNQEVIEHLIRNCPHINNKLEIPVDFDPFIGASALDKCLEAKRNYFESEESCMQYKD